MNCYCFCGNCTNRAHIKFEVPYSRLAANSKLSVDMWLSHIVANCNNNEDTPIQTRRLSHPDWWCIIGKLLVSRSGLMEVDDIDVFHYYGFHLSSSFLM